MAGGVVSESPGSPILFKIVNSEAAMSWVLYPLASVQVMSQS